MLNFGCRNSKRTTTFSAVELQLAAWTAVCLSSAIVGEATSVCTKCLLQLSIHCGIVKLTKDCEITILRFCATSNIQPSSCQIWQMSFETLSCCLWFHSVFWWVVVHTVCSFHTHICTVICAKLLFLAFSQAKIWSAQTGKLNRTTGVLSFTGNYSIISKDCR